MGFPSPAGDYVEQRFSPASMCITNTSRILDTSSGFAVIEPVTRLVQGQTLPPDPDWRANAVREAQGQGVNYG